MSYPLDEAFFDVLFDGVYAVDRERRITFWNAAAERITGYSREEVVGSPCAAGLLRHIDHMGRDLCKAGCPLMACMEDGEHREAEIFLHHRDGHRVPVTVRVSPVRDASGAVVGAVEVFSDLGGRGRIIREIQELRREAYIDGLTGVGNRRFADLTLDTRFRERREYGIDFGVLLLDVDRCKQLNALLGREVVDRLLRMVARSMVAACRDLDVVCRWGGEEFLVAVPNIGRAGLAEIGERLRVFVESSWFMHDGQEVRATVSVGGAVVRPGDDTASILRRAEMRMHSCKGFGRNRLEVE